jgi:hypothetical protein
MLHSAFTDHNVLQYRLIKVVSGSNVSAVVNQALNDFVPFEVTCIHKRCKSKEVPTVQSSPRTDEYIDNND